jgi:CubicO group peptidase (beta-lactamase class C family)
MLVFSAIAGTVLASLAITARANVVLTDETPLSGPSFLANFDPSEAPAVQDAIANFPDVIEGLFSVGTLVRDDLIFYIDVFSSATGGSIYSYGHVGEGQEDALTAGALDEHSIARVGSVTKLFTVYAIIKHAGIGVLGHPVTEYLPELVGSNRNASSIDQIDWDHITVGALASHQAGVGGAVGACKRPLGNMNIALMNNRSSHRICRVHRRYYHRA